MALRVAFLVNQYPAVSQTFIRREIHALERRGIVVQRIALRGWDAVLVDNCDKQELTRTRYVLKAGAAGLALAVLKNALVAPLRWLAALRLACRMAKGSDRPLPLHLVYFAEACQARLWLAESKGHHLHAHFATNSADVAMLVHALGGPPYSFTAHGSDIMDRPAQMGLHEKVSRASFVAAVCWYGRSQILRWIPQRMWTKVSVVRCGLERGHGSGAEEAAEGAASQRLLCVGRLAKEKGQLLLVEAAAKLAAAGQEIDIVLAGDGPMRGEIEALIASSGLDGRVRITGWLDAQGIEQQMHAARALVVPSLSEGLPVVIMEAMANRRPVVAPFLAGIPELVLDGKTGWLYPAGNVDALADAMQHCLAADPAELARMGETASDTVWAAHDVDAEAAKLAALISRSARGAGV
jgi:colanic acid/amylovoran biosynthesis glycosyltransferase